MHNNEEVLPHFILQLIHLFAVLPPETAFLSVYESGSKDSTGALFTPLSCYGTRMDGRCIPSRLDNHASGEDLSTWVYTWRSHA